MGWMKRVGNIHEAWCRMCAVEPCVTLEVLGGEFTVLRSTGRGQQKSQKENQKNGSSTGMLRTLRRASCCCPLVPVGTKKLNVGFTCCKMKPVTKPSYRFKETAHAPAAASRSPCCLRGTSTFPPPPPRPRGPGCDAWGRADGVQREGGRGLSGACSCAGQAWALKAQA